MFLSVNENRLPPTLKKPPTEPESLAIPLFCRAKKLECDNIRHHKHHTFGMISAFAIDERTFTLNKL
ncbi:hypothetical protein BCU12_21450 [Vibrio sp. 10N.261.55.A7]|nr:hypothetical protein BCU12_21450 [Vibrio sp. 10N.261.55.A7]